MDCTCNHRSQCSQYHLSSEIGRVIDSTALSRWIILCSILVMISSRSSRSCFTSSPPLHSPHRCPIQCQRGLTTIHNTCHIGIQSFFITSKTIVASSMPYTITFLHSSSLLERIFLATFDCPADINQYGSVRSR